MNKFHTLEDDLPTYHSSVHKIVGISSSRVLFMVHHSQRNGGGPLHYSTPRKDILKGLLNEPNVDHFKILFLQEVDIPTYHFSIHKNIGISSSRIMHRLHDKSSHSVGNFFYFAS